MIPSARVLLASCVMACTYNEYHNYGAGGGGGDGQTARAGSAGEAGSSAQAGAGGDAGNAGEGGSSQTEAGSGGQGPAADDCTGCLRLELPPNRESNLQLSFTSNRDFSDTVIVWRMRVIDFSSGVSLLTYAENVDPALNALNFASLTSEQGWQDVGLDLNSVDEFREPGFFDAGGAAGSGFDPGQPFDKSKVRAIGIKMQPSETQGLLTPVKVEIDIIRFSNLTGENIDFASNDGGVEFTDSDGAVLTHVPD